MDLAAYFDRIGYDGPRTANAAVLEAIAHRHALSIPFENLDAWLGLPVSLEPDAVFDKLVIRRRGGWCFEQNLLLGNVLRELGYDVTDLGGRVVWGRTADAISARTHRLLRVRCDGREWLADAGFGGLTPTGVLDLNSVDEQPTPHEPFRLRRLPPGSAGVQETLLEALVRGEWLPMYRFDLQPQQPVDFEPANYQLSTDPQSRFVKGLVVTRPTATSRPVLRDLDLIVYSAQGASEPRALRKLAELRQVLEQMFGLDLTGLDGLEARFERDMNPDQMASPTRS